MGVLRGVVSSESGFSMVLVLLIVALLIIIAAEFMYTVRVESRTTKNFKDEVEAQSLAMAGINMAIAEILGDYDIVALDEDGTVGFYLKEDGLAARSHPAREFKIDSGTVGYAIVDENSKLNLNNMKRETLVELFRVAGIETDEVDVIADSMIDWKDSNHEYHLNGAEDDYYESLPRPYSAKDDSFDTTEALLLVRGMTPEIFYGGETHGCIGAYISAFGSGNVNINTAGETALIAEFGRGRADEILLRRKTSGYFDLPAYGGVVTSETFGVRSIGTAMGLKVAISAVVEKEAGSAGAPPRVMVRYWKEEGIVSE